jgi:ribonuclease Y
MNPGIVVIIAILTLAVGIALGYRLHYSRAKQENARLQIKADNILTEAEEKAKEFELQAKDKAIQVRQQAEGEVSRRRAEISREEDRLTKRREELENRTDRQEKREAALNKRQSAIDKRANDVEQMYENEMAELQRISEMTQEEARGVLIAEVEKGARDDMARIIRQVEAEAQEDGDRRAREIITTAIQRVASDHVSEVTTSTVTIPSDEMKGRIIGRNGRNIHAFEQAAGVDVIVDDTPEAVTISCFDPVRREIARRSLAKLVLDGRIHPAHVEKVLKNEQKEVEHIIIEAGEQAAFDAGVPGLHPEVTKMLGRLKFRTSYGQNQLDHAVEAPV